MLPNTNWTLDPEASAIVLKPSRRVRRYINSTLQSALAFNGGAQTTFDSAIISNDGATLTDSYFSGWSSVERLTTANGLNSITLGTNANAAGIATVTGGTGNDTLNASSYTISVNLSGGNGNDSLLSGSAAATLSGGSGNDSLFSGNANDTLSGGDGSDWIQGASSISVSQIDTLTGGAGNDTFVLGDTNNSYYNAAANGVDYALITDFATGDLLRLKNLNSAAAGNGYVISTNALYGNVGNSNYYLYIDSDNSGAANAGDNLIAGINSTIELTTANLKSTHGTFI